MFLFFSETKRHRQESGWEKYVSSQRGPIVRRRENNVQKGMKRKSVQMWGRASLHTQVNKLMGSVIPTHWLRFKMSSIGTSLWLRLGASNAEAMGWIPGWGTEVPHVAPSKENPPKTETTTHTHTQRAARTNEWACVPPSVAEPEQGILHSLPFVDYTEMHAGVQWSSLLKALKRADSFSLLPTFFHSLCLFKILIF